MATFLNSNAPNLCKVLICDDTDRIEPWKERKGGLERHKSHRRHLSILNYWTLEIKKKKCISFIIWVTALAYNEMLINWPLFISLVICRFTLIILLFHLELTHGHIAGSLSLFISLYFWFTMFCKSFRGKCKQWLQHSLRWIRFGAKMQIYVSLQRRVYRVSSSRISIS